MSSSLLHDVDLKIQWANHRFRDFNVFGRRWVRDDTNRPVVEIDPRTREVLYRMSQDFYVPRDFALIAGDIFQNLRTALDYLACALVLANKGKITNETCFPIVGRVPSTPKEEESFAGKIKGMSDAATNRIRSCKPYRGGDDILWRVHELNRREKHRLLITVGGYLSNWSILQHVEATSMPLHRLERLARAYASDETWSDMRKFSFPLKAGDVVLRDPPDTKVNENLKIEIQIAINEAGVCEGEPLRPILVQSIGRVHEVVRRFDGMY